MFFMTLRHTTIHSTPTAPRPALTPSPSPRGRGERALNALIGALLLGVAALILVCASSVQASPLRAPFSAQATITGTVASAASGIITSTNDLTGTPGVAATPALAPPQQSALPAA